MVETASDMTVFDRYLHIPERIILCIRSEEVAAPNTIISVKFQHTRCLIIWKKGIVVLILTFLRTTPYVTITANFLVMDANKKKFSPLLQSLV